VVDHFEIVMIEKQKFLSQKRKRKLNFKIKQNYQFWRSFFIADVLKEDHICLSDSKIKLT
jgi:hypothetical protein